MLRVFHAHAARAPAIRPVLIEAPFNVELRDPITGEVLDEKLTGVIDLVAEREGRLRIFEHKTSARRYGRDQLDFDLQPTAYLYAARELRVEVEGVTFQVLTKAATPVVQVEDVERDRRRARVPADRRRRPPRDRRRRVLARPWLGLPGVRLRATVSGDSRVTPANQKAPVRRAARKPGIQLDTVTAVTAPTATAVTNQRVLLAAQPRAAPRRRRVAPGRR
jgi:hypothetical protein